MKLNTTISGIPCIAEVLNYTSAELGMITSASTEPLMDEDYELNIYDRKGYHAPWLEKKLTMDDEARIIEEYLDERAAW